VIRHTVTALATAGVLLAGACSSGDGSKAAAASDDGARADTSERFCSSAQALYTELENAGAADPSSPAVQAVFDDARELVAPDEIAADWTEVLDAIEPLVSGEVDLNDPAAMASITDRTAQAADAFQRTGAYFEDECDFGGTTSSTAGTPEAPAAPDAAPVAPDAATTAP
jgi:hypothetical protein